MPLLDIDEGAREEWHCSICNAPDLCLRIKVGNEPPIHMCQKCEKDGLALVARAMAEHIR